MHSNYWRIGNTATTGNTKTTLNPYEIILRPYVTEKTMDQMERLNRLEFIVKRTANKPQIKRAFENLFEVKAVKVNTRIQKEGKHATITLSKEHSAEDVGARIGVF